MKNRKTKNRSGFTLLEALIATVLIGVAVVAMIASNGAFTKVNGAGLTLSNAEFLLEQVREMTATLPVIDPDTGNTTFGAEEASLASYDDLDDFDNKSFSPPIDINRSEMTDLSAYTQQVTVNNVSHGNLETVTADHSTDIVRVTVAILLNGTEVTSSSWIRTNR